MSDRHLTSGDAVNLSSDVAGLITCEEHEDRGKLGRLLVKFPRIFAANTFVCTEWPAVN